MPTHPLTYEHRRILHFIRAYRAARGVSPTYQDIRDAIGFRTTGPVQNRLRDLRRWGYVARRPGEARGILLLRMPPRRPLAQRIRRKARIPVVLEALRARRKQLRKALYRLIEPVHARIDGLIDRAQTWLGRRLGRLPYDPARP